MVIPHVVQRPALRRKFIISWGLRMLPARPNMIDVRISPWRGWQVRAVAVVRGEPPPSRLPPEDDDGPGARRDDIAVYYYDYSVQCVHKNQPNLSDLSHETLDSLRRGGLTSYRCIASHGIMRMEAPISLDSLDSTHCKQNKIDHNSHNQPREEGEFSTTRRFDVIGQAKRGKSKRENPDFILHERS